MTPILACEGLAKSYGGVRALAGIGLSVPAGEVLGIIGPNGSGKTTLFNVLSGHERPDAGTVAFDGRAVTGRPAHRIAALGLSRTFQNLRLFAGLTALENVLGGGHLRAKRGIVAQLVQAPATRAAERRDRERARHLLDEVGLSDRADAFATDLSYGQTKRLELARALNTEPRVLLLDEPVAGMNDRQAAEILALVMAARERRGLTLVIIEHNVPVLVRLVERLVAFEAGSVIAEGRPAEVVRHPRVVSAYLGAAA